MQLKKRCRVVIWILLKCSKRSNALITSLDALAKTCQLLMYEQFTAVKLENSCFRKVPLVLNSSEAMKWQRWGGQAVLFMCSRFYCMECCKDEDRKFCVNSSGGTKCIELNFMGYYHACLICLFLQMILLSLISDTNLICHNHYVKYTQSEGWRFQHQNSGFNIHLLSTLGMNMNVCN